MVTTKQGSRANCSTQTGFATFGYGVQLKKGPPMLKPNNDPNKNAYLHIRDLMIIRSLNLVIYEFTLLEEHMHELMEE